ncbi:MAG: hypothetical protein MK329_00585 [Pirellulales bacterium]|nr:hypothetical protein [Pirellulales bacterium]
MSCSLIVTSVFELVTRKDDGVENWPKWVYIYAVAYPSRYNPYVRVSHPG